MTQDTVAHVRPAQTGSKQTGRMYTATGLPMADVLPEKGLWVPGELLLLQLLQ
jgi:hypothetical protein